MSIPTYVAGYPQDGSSLGNTRVQIRKNLDGTFETLSIDHQNQNETNPGYHAVVHWETQGSNPPTVSNITQEFTKTDSNSIQQKWLLSTGGNAYQETTMLDGDFAAFAQANGWSWLPGGILIQWGTTTSTGSATTVSFPLTFPNNAFSINVTRSQSTGSSTSYGVTSFSTSGFVFNANSSSVGVRFWWIAIGN